MTILTLFVYVVGHRALFSKTLILVPLKLKHSKRLSLKYLYCGVVVAKYIVSLSTCIYLNELYFWLYIP